MRSFAPQASAAGSGEDEATMFYDARISMGMLFTLIGTILAALGLGTRDNPGVYAKSLGIDANLWWGLVLLGFGIVVMMLGRRGQARIEKDHPSQPVKSKQRR